MGVCHTETVTAALLAGLAAGYGIAVPVGAVGVYLVALSALTDRVSVRIAAALGVATADGGYALVAVFGGAAVVNALEPVATPLRWASAAVLVAIAVTVGGTAIARYRRGEQPDGPRAGTATGRAGTGTPNTASPRPAAPAPGQTDTKTPSNALRRLRTPRTTPTRPDTPAAAHPHPATPAAYPHPESPNTARPRSDKRPGTPEAARSAPRAYATLLALTALNPATVAYFAALVVGDGARVAGTPATGTVFALAAFAASAGWQLTLACGGALLGRFVASPRGRLATAAVSSIVVTGLAVGILLR